MARDVRLDCGSALGRSVASVAATGRFLRPARRRCSFEVFAVRGVAGLVFLAIGRTLATSATRGASAFGHATVWEKGESGSDCPQFVAGLASVSSACPRSLAGNGTLLVGIVYAARRRRARCSVNMTGFTTNRRERVLCCRYLGGRNRHTRFPVVLALRRGARRLDLITPISEGTGSLTYRPEGRRPRSCRRTPRVSPLVLVGATLRSATLWLDRGSAPGFA